MISDALKFLADLGAKAAGAANKAVPLEFPGDPHNRYLVGADGILTKLARLVPDRNHQLQRLSDIPKLATRLAMVESDDSLRLEPTGSIWIDAGTVTVDSTGAEAYVHLVLRDTWPHDSSRADRAVCELPVTPEFEALCRENGGTGGLSQQAFRRLLQVDLAPCSVPQRLLDWVAKITWNNGRRQVGAVGTGRESLGIDIESAAISDAGEAPETVVLRVRPFADPLLTLRADVTCLFVADAKNQTLALIPLGGEMEAAWDEALQFAENELARALPNGFPIYRGRP
jgi:hypothetical protein